VYGGYVLAMGWALLVARFGSLGFPRAVLRLIPKYRVQQKAGKLRGLMKAARQFTVAGTVLVSALIAASLLGLEAFSPDAQTATLAGMVVALPLALFRLETEVVRAFDRVVRAYAVSEVARPLLVIGGIVLLPLAIRPQSTPGLLLWVGVVLALCASALFFLSRRRKGDAARPAQLVMQRRAWLRVSVPMLIAGGFLLLITKTDVFVVGALLGTEEAGWYGAALQTAHIVLFVGVALDAVATPRLSQFHTEGDRGELQRFVSQLAHAHFWPSCVLAILLVLSSPIILGWFGPGFAAHRLELLILVGGLLVNAGTGGLTPLLLMTGYQRTCAWIYGVSALLNLVLNLVGVSLFGLTGAAVATALTILFWSVWQYVVCVQRLEIYPTILDALRSRPR
jgi:O-antigen/teichoic acid export membrane protein